MQAVILAAGNSTRMYPLTVDTPKPLLRILDRTILEHNIDELMKTGHIDEILVVVGFGKEKIKASLSEDTLSGKVRFIEQTEMDGTGGAILACKEHLEDRFLIINGDDLYSHKDLSRCLEHDLCVMAKEVEDPSKWGIFTYKEGLITSIVEKPEDSGSNLANVGVYLLDRSIFDYSLKGSARGELEIIDYLNYMIDDGKRIDYELVKDYWLPVGYPWQYLEANVFFLRRMQGEISGEIEENVICKGPIHLGKGSVIRSNSYIEGPVYIGEGCEIGPNAHIRPDTIIFDDVRIGKTEVYDAVIMDGTVSKHFGYIGHSVIGKGCNIGAGTVTGDYRHDSGPNWTMVKGKKVDTGRRKLGAFIGDQVRTGVGTLIYPGRKLWPETTTLPGEVVAEDKVE